MEFQNLMRHRRSIRKYADRAVPAEVIDRIIGVTLTAPSSRNSRSTRLLVVDDPALVARMSEMRDFGSSFMKGAPLAIVVLGDSSLSDMHQINAAISATILHQAAVDEGLGSCWVQIAGRPRLKADPTGESAEDFLREFLPIPPACQPLCAIVMGYSDFQPKPVPPAADSSDRVIRI